MAELSLVTSDYPYPSGNRPSAEFLHECFDCREGVLYWKERPASHFQKPADQMSFNTKTAGAKAGKVGSRGYITVGLRVNGKAISMAAHRVIWAMHYGKWPDYTIDHINRNRTDNRIENLRDIPMHENLRNNGNPLGSGLRGVHQQHGRFQSVARVGVQSVHLGTFDTAEEALQLRVRAEEAALAVVQAYRFLSRPSKRRSTSETDRAAMTSTTEKE